MATIGTDFALGRNLQDHENNAGPMLQVVVAPRDRTRDTENGAGEYVVMKHDGLSHGAEILIDSPRLRPLRWRSEFLRFLSRMKLIENKQLSWTPKPEPITDDAYRDPVPGFEGRWIISVAPLSNTGFLVIVQSRYDSVVEPNVWLSGRVVWNVGAVILVWVMVLGASLWGYTRRRRRARTSHPDSTPSSLHFPKKINTNPRMAKERNDLEPGQTATSSTPSTSPSTPRQRKPLRRSAASSRPSTAGHDRERTSPKLPDGPPGPVTG